MGIDGSDRTPGSRYVDLPPAREVSPGEAIGRAQQPADRALKHNAAAAFSWLGTDLDDVVGRTDHGLVMLDDDDRVAGGGERADDADEAFDVARVQADAGLVEHEQRVDQRRAETGGEVDAFDFASAQRTRGAVEGEIAEADLLEIAQTRDDGIVGEIGGVGAGGGFGVLGFGF